MIVNLESKSLAWAMLIVFVVGIGLGAWGMHTWEVSDLRTQLALEKAKPPVVKETVKTVTDTKLQYVKGETVYIPVPGKQDAPPEAKKLDGKFTFEKPEFVYTVNGKPGRFTKADDEKFIFEKNMLALTQTSTIRIEAEIPTIDKTKRHSLGGWYTNQGFAVSAGYAPMPYVEAKVIVGVPDPSKLMGGGIEIRF